MQTIETRINIINDEKGAALITVLVMLLLLTILGVTLLTSSTTDLQIAGNYRNSQQAFYFSDATAELVQTGNLPGGENIYTKIIPGVQNVYSSTISIDGHTASYKVEYVGSGPVPYGSGFDDTFQSNFYSIETKGLSNNNTLSEIDSEIARIVPKVKDY